MCGESGAGQMTVLHPFMPEDIGLLHKWLYLPHIRQWYERPEEWLREALNIGGEFYWIYQFIIMYDATPVGFCQFYEYRLGGESWHGDIDTDGVYSIDYLIGETDYLRHGVGSAAISLMTMMIRQRSGAKKIIVKPDSDNYASCELLQSCRFLYYSERDFYYYDLLRDAVK